MLPEKRDLGGMVKTSIFQFPPMWWNYGSAVNGFATIKIFDGCSWVF